MGNDKPVALVTGGSKRVGRAIVKDLAAAGFGVVIHANSSLDEATALANELREDGATAHAIQANLTDTGETKSLVKRAAEMAGSIRLLINNASIFEPDGLGSLDDTLIDRHFALHLKAPAYLAEAMQAQSPEIEDGLIVNLIDERVWKLTPRYFSYTVSKSALWTATQTMAQALAPHIRVNAIGPGPTLPHSRQSEQDFKDQVSRLLLERSPDLSEFGATIRYFWEAKSVTGQMIALDGGQHLAWETPEQSGRDV